MKHLLAILLTQLGWACAVKPGQFIQPANLDPSTIQVTDNGRTYTSTSNVSFNTGFISTNGFGPCEPVRGIQMTVNSLKTSQFFALSDRWVIPDYQTMNFTILIFTNDMTSAYVNGLGSLLGSTRIQVFLEDKLQIALNSSNGLVTYWYLKNGATTPRFLFTALSPEPAFPSYLLIDFFSAAASTKDLQFIPGAPVRNTIVATDISAHIAITSTTFLTYTKQSGFSGWDGSTGYGSSAIYCESSVRGFNFTAASLQTYRVGLSQATLCASRNLDENIDVTIEVQVGGSAVVFVYGTQVFSIPSIAVGDVLGLQFNALNQLQFMWKGVARHNITNNIPPFPLAVKYAFFTNSGSFSKLYWTAGVASSVACSNSCNLVNFYGSLDTMCLPCACSVSGSASQTCDVVTGQCPCIAGFRGRMCQFSDACLSSPCQNVGTCNFNINDGTFTCTCAKGYNGTLCSTSANPSSSIASETLHVATTVNPTLPMTSYPVLSSTIIPTAVSSMASSILVSTAAPSVTPSAIITTAAPSMVSSAIITTAAPSMAPSTIITTTAPSMVSSAIIITAAPSMAPSILVSTTALPVVSKTSFTTAAPSVASSAFVTTTAPSMAPSILVSTTAPSMAPSILVSTTALPVVSNTSFPTAAPSVASSVFVSSTERSMISAGSGVLFPSLLTSTMATAEVATPTSNVAFATSSSSSAITISAPFELESSTVLLTSPTAIITLASSGTSSPIVVTSSSSVFPQATDLASTARPPPTTPASSTSDQPLSSSLLTSLQSSNSISTPSFASASSSPLVITTSSILPFLTTVSTASSSLSTSTSAPSFTPVLILCATPDTLSNTTPQPIGISRAENELLTYTCILGYSTNPSVASLNNFTVQCLSSGSFSAPTSECQPVSCGSPSVSFATKSQATSSSVNVLYQSSAVFSCNNGFSNSGLTDGGTSFSVTCLANGSFDYDSPTAACLRICAASTALTAAIFVPLSTGGLITAHGINVQIPANYGSAAQSFYIETYPTPCQFGRAPVGLDAASSWFRLHPSPFNFLQPVRVAVQLDSAQVNLNNLTLQYSSDVTGEWTLAVDLIATYDAGMVTLSGLVAHFSVVTSFNGQPNTTPISVVTAPTSGGSAAIGLAVGAAVGGIVVLIILVLVMMFLRRRSNEKKFTIIRQSSQSHEFLTSNMSVHSSMQTSTVALELQPLQASKSQPYQPTQLPPPVSERANPRFYAASELADTDQKMGMSELEALYMSTGTASSAQSNEKLLRSRDPNAPPVRPRRNVSKSVVGLDPSILVEEIHDDYEIYAHAVRAAGSDGGYVGLRSNALLVASHQSFPKTEQSDPSPGKLLDGMDIDRSNLFMLDELGRGEFGVVWEAEYVHGSTREFFAVKTLKHEASEKDKSDFLSEGELLRQFNHPNVLGLVSVSTEYEPWLIIIEYCPYGDLRNFLRRCAANIQLNVTFAEQLHLACQIAQGMNYLGSLKFIHRDLAARNCLVGLKSLVKVADFGLSRQMGTDDYYRVMTKGKLPVRWMALESIEFRKFSSKSDVWSFGILLWEIMTFGTLKPYNNTPVRELSAQLREGKRLPCPARCPANIYALMVQCWQVDSRLRPTFAAIDQTLTKLVNSYIRTSGQSVRDLGEELGQLTLASTL